MTQRVLMAVVNGGRVRGRKRLGWMWAWPWTKEEWRWSATMTKDRKQWRALAHITEWVSLGPVFFQTTLPCSGGYHLEKGGMPLHDAVKINCKNGATTENQGQGQAASIWAKGCMLMIVCVYVDLAWLPILGGGRKSWYIILLGMWATKEITPADNFFLLLLFT